MAEKPFPTPGNLAEQLQNLVWRLAVEMRALFATLKTKLSAEEAAETYLTKTDAADTYLGKTDAADTYLGKTDAADTYLGKTDAADTYLGKTAKAESAKTADSAASVDWFGIKNVPEDIGSGTLNQYFGAEAIVDMYNGYYETDLDPKDYVSVSANDVLTALTAMHTQYYQGAANG